MRAKPIFQIFAEIEAARSLEDRKALLAGEGRNATVLRILRYAFDPTLVFDLPEGPVPYTPMTSPEDQTANIYTVIGKSDMLQYCLTSYPLQGPNFPNAMRKQIFRQQKIQQILESVHPSDAEILNAVKDKKLPYKKIDLKLVQSVFPDLIPSLKSQELATT